MDNNLGQVVLVKDIFPGVYDGNDRSSFLYRSDPGSLIEFNDKLYFSANDGESGRELFVSDGTAAGTRLVADINPNAYESNDEPPFPYGSNPSQFIEFNNKLYFTANNGESGDELFVSNGTRDGTQLLVDINPGVNDGNYGPPVPKSSYPNNFFEFNNKLYFTANNGESGDELFVSDGTAEGTQLLVDINPNINSNYGPSFPEGSNPSQFIEFNNKLYFTADDGESGRELYVTDGTAEGTQLLVDLNPNVNDDNYRPTFTRGSNPSQFIEFNNKLYFSANDGENGRQELFVSDGTVEGTQLLVDLNPDVYEGNFGFSFPISSYPSDFIEFDNKLYFAANDGENGTELFISDGTAEGTQLLVDLNPSINDSYYGSSFPKSSNPTNFVEFNGKLYFIANDGESGRQLFVSDGTADGTQLVTDINSGTQLLVDLRPLDNYDYRSNALVEFNNKLYFTGDDGTSGTELFVTDGTRDGTQLLADLNPGSSYRSGYYGFYPFEPTLVRDELFFAARSAEAGTELFKLTLNPTVAPSQSLNPITGTANDDNLVGTDADDEIAGGGSNDGVTGQAGNDMLNGRIGNDALDGGAGNDTIDGGEGTDTVVYQFAPAGVDVVLGEGETIGTASDGYGSTDSLSNLENVIGSDFNDNLTGNSGNNSLTGRAGNDTILGLSGDDFLTGGAGADTMSGGEGSDLFVYLNASEGRDTINDFVVGVDKIAVVAAGFGSGLSAGELPQDRFTLGSAAIGNQTGFVFDNTSGELLFDADGAGVADAELIATLDGVSNLSAEDIMLL